MPLTGLALVVFLLNIPFGYWRTSVPKYSWRWALAIHLPIPVVVLLRILSGIGFMPVSYPVLVGAFFLGQFTGGRLKLWLLNNGSW